MKEGDVSRLKEIAAEIEENWGLKAEVERSWEYRWMYTVKVSAPTGMTIAVLYYVWKPRLEVWRLWEVRDLFHEDLKRLKEA